MREAEPYEYDLTVAKKELATSDHLTYVTYATINDIRFLASIATHITKAVKLALQALLECELAYKRIEPYVKELASQIDLFEENIYPRYHFTADHLKLMHRLKTLEKTSKEAVIRFRRDNKYYFGGPNMKTESLDLKDIKTYLRLTKSFIAEIDKIIKGEYDS